MHSPNTKAITNKCITNPPKTQQTIKATQHKNNSKRNPNLLQNQTIPPTSKQKVNKPPLKSQNKLNIFNQK